MKNTVIDLRLLKVANNRHDGENIQPIGTELVFEEYVDGIIVCSSLTNRKKFTLATLDGWQIIRKSEVEEK